MKTSSKDFITTLGIKYPLVVAPMAGGPSSDSLVIAASEAGALGSVGAAYLAPNAILEMSERIRQVTAKPFAINLFIPGKTSVVSDALLKSALETTQVYRDELELPQPVLTPPYAEDFCKQFEAVLKIKPAALSFIFGVLPSECMKETKARGIYTLGTATSPAEASLLQESGVDAIVIQGFEAGGHRGIFDPSATDPAINTLDLLKAVRSEVKIPVIAAGGIMTRDDVQLMLRSGADAVQMGTAFLATQEAGTSLAYRRELLRDSIRTTRTTRAFSGRLARGLVNRFMMEMDRRPDAILPFPIQNKFTRDLRNAAVLAHRPEFLSLWAGDGRGELWKGSTKDFILSLFPKAAD